MDNSAEANVVFAAAQNWARAMEAVAAAEENRQPLGNEVDVFEAAESVLYAAVVQWRVANAQIRPDRMKASG